MDEHVFAAVLAGDEAEPFGVVEPFHLSGDRNGGRRIGRNPARPHPIAGWPLRPLDDTGRVDFKNSSDLCAFGARADLDAQFGPRRNRVVAGCMQGVGVQERIARPPASSTKP